MTASAAMKRDALLPQRPDGLGRGLMLAIAVHIGLVIALAIGVNWRSRPPEAMSAELWSAVPQMAAPRAVEPEPPKPEPPKPVPQPAPLPKVETPTPNRDADIAIEKARKQAEEERREQEELQRQRDEKKRQDKLAADRQAAQERARQQQLEAEAERKRLAEEQRAAVQREALRKEQLARMMGQANASGDEHSTGRAQQSSGPSANYAGRIKARIKPNIVFTDDLPGNPVATVEVRLAPDGSVLGTPRLLKSSGSRAWDDAVVRAVVKTETLPRDVDGRVPSSMEIDFRPRE